MRFVYGCVLAIASTLPTIALADDAEVRPVGRQEAARCIRGVIPLPHEISIRRTAVAKAGPLAVSLLRDSGAIGAAAAKDLADALSRAGGVEVGVNEAKTGVGNAVIEIGVCDRDGRLATGEVVPGAARLFKLPNAGQAYRIAPLGDRTLALTAAQPQGLYYAVQTLKQLVAAAPPAGSGNIAIPLADVTDWPDMAERGLWGGDVNDDMPWLSQWKLNLIETHTQRSLGPDGRGVASIPQDLLDRAGRNAVNLAPVITHLDQLPPALFVRYPELKGVSSAGERKAWRNIGDDLQSVCFSQPKAEEVLADWLTCLARYPEVSDVMVWLGEENVSCHCPRCAAVNPFVLQTQVALRAWQSAKRVKPALRLRILLTQGSYESNAKVLAVVPPEVAVTYYDGNRTYDSSRRPMIYPLLTEFAAKGGALGCVPQLTASYRVVCPWTAPQFIKARMTEFVDKRLRRFVGYATPSDRFFEFNIAAAAEWSWNAHGRSEREFSAAWAARQGIADPEKFADWADALGLVGWDVYGGRVPYFWVTRGVSRMFQQGKPPQLGSGVFTYFPTGKRFEEDSAACDRAMRLAEELHSPAMIAETHVIHGMVEMLMSLYGIAEATAVGDKADADQRQQAAVSMQLLDLASEEARGGLLAWGNAAAPKMMPPEGFSVRFADTVDCFDKVTTEASDALAALNIPDPKRPYRVRHVGGWATDDFKAGPAQRKTWDVGFAMSGPGRYEVTFHYEGGWYGAKITAVRLVAGPAGSSSQRTEVARDVHEGTTGDQLIGIAGRRQHPPRNATYTLTLKDYDHKRHYHIVADLEGVPASSTPDRFGCTGYATMRLVAPQ